MKSQKSASLQVVNYWEWQASLWGACIIAFGLGILLVRYFDSYTPLIILAGVALHSWGMYKMHLRNK